MVMRFSICICTYNRASQLARCLESVLSQDYPSEDYEILVVDNGSTDHTGIVLQEYRKKSARLRTCYESEAGLSRARNRAGDEAHGEWLCYLDDDAIAPDGWLSTAAQVIETEAPDLVGGPVVPFYDTPRPAWFLDAYGTIGHGDRACWLPPGKHLLGGNLFIRRAIFDSSGGFPLEFGMIGSREYYGDETAFQNRLRRSRPDLRVFYDPMLTVRHRVAPHKMSLRWRLRHRFVESRAGFLARGDKIEPVQPIHLAAYAAMPVILAAEATVGVITRDRVRYPNWQNYYYEVVAGRMATWGRIHERIRQRLRRVDPFKPGLRIIRHRLSQLRSVIRRTLRTHPRRFDLDLRIERRAALQRRALLSYIVHPFDIEPDDPRFLRHINVRHAREIVRILNEMGYLVDVVDYRDTKFSPVEAYDLFIGHGGFNFCGIAGSLPDRTPKIYFSTGAYWRFHNREAHLRTDDLKRRRGIFIPPERPIPPGEEDALLAADGILGIGNEFTRSTYSGFERVIMIDGSSPADPAVDPAGKNYRSARQNFVFYASHGNVHKGLDLLLEAFRGLSEQLWIVAPLERRFRSLFRAELERSANIHAIGWIQPRSKVYYSILGRCAWCVLPSCSEGQAQSVIEALGHGLIPLVSRASGVDVADFGFLIEPDAVKIRTTVVNLSRLAEDEIRERSRQARDAAETRYSEASFRLNFRRALEELLADIHR